MRIFGVVCECNPLHTGHIWLLSQARARGAEAVVCAMSGNFVQRGEPALLPWWVRARALLENGADLVVQIPTAHCLSSAQFYAQGGVSLLAALGVDTLFFGSESGDRAGLEATADLVESEAFVQLAKALQRGNLGYPAARAEACRRLGGEAALLSSPNDTLALEYLLAIRRAGAGMNILPIRRIGAGHHDSRLGGQTASASALRALLRAGKGEEAAPYLPKGLPGPHPLADSRWLGRAAVLAVQLAPLERLAALPFCDEGLARRLQACADGAADLEELAARCASRQHTRARVRRAVWCLLLDIRRDEVLTPPDCLRILGATETGLALLRGPQRLPVCHSLARAEGTSFGRVEARADTVYANCFEKPLPQGESYRQKFTKI